MYLKGFGNYHQSEALEGALPTNQNSPQQSNLGLYAEQLSGTAFTKSRADNLHSWLYRKLPSVSYGEYKPLKIDLIKPFSNLQSPNPLRWLPLDAEYTNKESKDFTESLFHLAGNSQAQVFIYSFNKAMENSYFINRDGEFLFVPYEGEIALHTEFGLLHVEPGSIAVIPVGVVFNVVPLSKEAKGYLCENTGPPLSLPELGIIGANGLAHPRHFNYPTARFEQDYPTHEIICKYSNKLWLATPKHSPLNVVAWHGNYAPYSYDLSLFNTINTVSYDHPDPSLFTVLTSPSTTPEVAHLDFVIFPPRWLVAEHTFRPPYFHRNCMSELMGLIKGEYEAKQSGFLKGGISIHNKMTPHGPDVASFQKASEAELKPIYIDSLAFMFESNEPWLITEQAYEHPSIEKDYWKCWQGFEIANQK